MRNAIPIAQRPCRATMAAVVCGLGLLAAACAQSGAARARTLSPRVLAEHELRWILSSAWTASGLGSTQRPTSLLPLPGTMIAPPNFGESLLDPATYGRAIHGVKLRFEDLKPMGAMERGVASWYAESWVGKPTANGEIYDPNTLTAAHKTLPFNSLVVVRNLDNGRALLVRINNRGPYIDGRIIDLSPAAAKALGCYDCGIANVELIRVH
ncbi:MAG: RlpA-like protein precursor [candidate division BRC1 bacterium ADurb.BinA364]|nr:MAG: RlpA-like protein precursor [candidate division BRC1 bacterium ADurb.BinA364]